MIGMGDRLTGRWPAPPDGHLEGVDDELRAHVIGDRPAHDPAAERVEDDGQVGLAVLGRVLGDIHHPQAIRLGGIEGPLDQVIGGLSTEVPTGAAAPAPPVNAGNLRLAHQAFDPFARAANVLAEFQLGVDPRQAIGAPAMVQMSTMVLDR